MARIAITNSRPADRCLTGLMNSVSCLTDRA